VRHGLIAGEKGVGKSNSLELILLGALNSSKYIICLIDWSPDQKHFHPFIEGGAAYRYSGNSLAPSLGILSGIARVIEYRARTAGYINPAPGKPAIMIAIEEAHLLFKSSKEAQAQCLKIVRDGAPVGVSLFITIPDASLESFGGNADLQAEMLQESNIKFYMGTGSALRMMRDARSVQINENAKDPYE